jgi:hypothetical protein
MRECSRNVHRRARFPNAPLRTARGAVPFTRQLNLQISELSLSSRHSSLIARHVQRVFISVENIISHC